VDSHFLVYVKHELNSSLLEREAASVQSPAELSRT
jgi:hypothetical protein